MQCGRAPCSTVCALYETPGTGSIPSLECPSPRASCLDGGTGGKEPAEPLWVPCPSWDSVPLAQLGSQPLSAGGCPEAERGRRRCCLLFPSDSLKTCCSLGLVIPQHPPEGAGTGAIPLQSKLEGEALLGPHSWRQRSLFPSSIPQTPESHLCPGPQCQDRDVGSKGLWCPPSPAPVPASALFVFSACPAVISTCCHSLDNTTSLLSLLN